MELIVASFYACSIFLFLQFFFKEADSFIASIGRSSMNLLVLSPTSNILREKCSE